MTTATSEATPFTLPRPPATDDELYWLVRAMWGVIIPRTQVCPDHVAPFTAFSDAYFGRNSLDPESPVQSIALWHGSRGLSGKSYALSALGITKAHMLGADVNLLGGSFAQSANIHEHMRAAMEAKNAPRYMVTDESNSLVRLSNRARIRPLTASQRTVRGPHPPFLLLDEIDEMELAILDAALGQPMEQKNYLGQVIKPYTVMCSTWQNPEGTFTEIIRRAEERGIPIYRWCYRESNNKVDGWLSDDGIAEKKASIPTEMWRVEYELGEPSIGNRAFDPDAIESTFSLPMTPIREKIAKDFEEYVFEDPQSDHPQYFIGADWAKEQDYTVIVVFKLTLERKLRLVYYARVNRRPYPIMIAMFNEAMQRYGAQGEYDKTGLGTTVADYLDMRAHGFMMVGDKRASMLSEYVNAVEKGELEIPKIQSAYIEHKYAQVGDLYSNAKAQGFHLPDTVCAFGLAYYRYRRQAPPVSPILIKKTEELNRYAKVFADPRQHNRVGDVIGPADREENGTVNFLV